MRQIDYDDAAASYDATRGASSRLLGLLSQALGPGNKRMLLDIGGGTGNYAVALGQLGFRAFVLDASAGMLGRAAIKLGHDAVVLGDACRLPLSDDSFDCAVSVNVIHHLPNWEAMIAEARRVLRQGPFVLQVYTRENVAANWIFQYFPEAFERVLSEHPIEQALAAALGSAGFSQILVEHYDHTDEMDLSLQTLSHRPEALLDETHRLNTSFFRRLPEREHRAGKGALERDYYSGRLQAVIGQYEQEALRWRDGTVFVAHP